MLFVQVQWREHPDMPPIDDVGTLLACLEPVRRLNEQSVRNRGNKQSRSPQKKVFTHGLTKCFQALRMAVNAELQQLEKLLRDAPSMLSRDSCLCIISFHSLEDRAVKTSFRRSAKSSNGTFEIVQRRGITPTDEELKSNPRSRSARLRVLRRR